MRMDDEEGRAGARSQAAAPEPGPRRRDPRALAAAYLDLWERHVTHAAVHGAPAPPPRPGGG
jgi:hypothetical protein